MNGPPPCAYGTPCLYDDEAGTCPCDDPPPPPVERDTETVPVGDYL
ncbi:hypothetical protein ABZ609_03460 [Streptomyces rubiginosohelvolus]